MPERPEHSLLSEDSTLSTNFFGTDCVPPPCRLNYDVWRLRLANVRNLDMLRSGDRIGNYTLIRKLGSGAFGTVWLSQRRTAITSTMVALKFSLDDDVDLETIKQEANLWVKASGHPNILPIIEADIYDDQLIIVSEYAPDGSLKSWLKQNSGKPPSIEVVVEIIAAILSGLEHLHTKGIIHRDLKPANILFQGNVPRLADFGISRALSTTHSGNIAGTPFIWLQRHLTESVTPKRIFGQLGLFFISYWLDTYLFRKET